MKASRIAYLGLALIVALLALCLSACTNSKVGGPDARLNAELVTHPVGLDSTNMSPTSMSVTPPPGPLSGIGHLFSTPEGRANRQAVRLAKAAVPRKLGKGAQYAPNALQAANGGNKPQAPTTAAASAATVSNAAENSQQQNVQGDNNGLTADKHDTVAEAEDWKAALASPVGKAVALIGSIVVLAAFGGICFYLWPYLPKRKDTAA
jgi:hypothetical protein